MIDNLKSKYEDISFEKINDIKKITELFNINNAEVKYDYFNFYISAYEDENIFSFQNNKDIIGVIAIYNIDMKNRNADIYGFIVEKKYYSELLKALLSLMGYAFIDLKLNKLNFIYREDNYFFDDVCRHLRFINEGILRNRLFQDNKYYNISINSILSHEYKRLAVDEYKKMYTWDYNFVPSQFVQIDITKYMNGRAFTDNINNSNNANLNDLREFVLSKNASNEQYLIYKGAKFDVNIFDTNTQYDNFFCENQKIKIEENYYSDILFVTMAQFGYQKSDITLIYEDNTSELKEFHISDWCERVLRDEYVIYYASGCRNLGNSVNIIKCDSFIYLKRIEVNPEKKLKSIVLPNNKDIIILGLGVCGFQQNG